MKTVTKTVLATTILASALMGGVSTITTMAKENKNDTPNTGEAKSQQSIFTKGNLNSFKDHYQKVENHVIHYEMREGKKNPDRTFVLSHGAFGTVEFMKIVATNLASEYPNSRIILVDLPWHGESKGPEKDLSSATIQTHTDIMKGFIKDLKTNKTISGNLNWVGWSMGGSIGMKLSLEGAGIDELTLLNSSPVWDTIEGLEQNVPASTDPTQINDFIKMLVDSEMITNISDKDRADVLAHYPKLVSKPNVMVSDVYAILPKNYDIQNQLKDIKAKTLVIGGTLDTVGELKHQYMLDDKIPNSSLLLLEDSHDSLVKPVIAKEMVNKMVDYFGK